MTWQLRRATLDDLGAIMAIETATFTDDAWSSATMRGELADGNSYYLVAFTPESPELVQAYAGLRAPRRAPQADIQTIAVVPGARRQGLGRVLMLQMIAQAREREAEELFLEVRADNPGAQALYSALGFEQIAQRPNYYGAGIDALIMRLTIEKPRVSIA